jgi:hypothetical protein
LFSFFPLLFSAAVFAPQVPLACDSSCLQLRPATLLDTLSTYFNIFTYFDDDDDDNTAIMFFALAFVVTRVLQILTLVSRLLFSSLPSACHPPRLGKEF